MQSYVPSDSALRLARGTAAANAATPSHVDASANDFGPDGGQRTTANARRQRQRRAAAARADANNNNNNTAPQGEAAAGTNDAAAVGGGARGRGNHGRGSGRGGGGGGVDGAGRGGGRGGRGGGQRRGGASNAAPPQHHRGSANAAATSSNSNNRGRLLPTPQVDNLGSLPDRSRELAVGLIDETLECVTCTEPLRLGDKVWACQGCHIVLHMKCINNWSRRDTSGPGEQFCCPQCRRNYDLLVNTCFCGMVTAPKFSPFIIPHSCGSSCGKKTNDCPHPCPLQCHPGPCAPCNKTMGPKPCPCGASTYSYPCGTEDPCTTCENTCNKLLSCGNHRCGKQCHTGACDACDIAVQTSCVCKKHVRDSACGVRSAWQCEEPCGKALPCGNHQCPLVCHTGPCPPCDGDPSVVTHCPCGAAALTATRSSCLSPIPSCGAVCGRPLTCDLHTCADTCHEGPCAPCGVRVEASCRCRRSRKLVPCEERDRWECERACGTKLSCGVHHCQTRCCVDRQNAYAAAHTCLSICGRTLPCGHTCMENCHRGSCPPCLNVSTERIFCRCGISMWMPPQPCGFTPSCPHPCSLPRPCGHEALHTCHEGDCPPCGVRVTRTCAGCGGSEVTTTCANTEPTCQKTCNKPLPCGHTCQRVCHLGLCTTKACNTPCGRVNEVCGHACRSQCHGGADTECPPCTFPVDITCGCGTEKKRMTCWKRDAAIEKHASEADDPHTPLELPCTNRCWHQQRLSALSSVGKKAQTGSTLYMYPSYLWERALEDRTLVEHVEKQLASFLQSNEPMASLPPANIERRALVHALAVHYRIKVEGLDHGENRACMLTRLPNSELPPITLSESVQSPKNDPNVFYNRVVGTQGGSRSASYCQLVLYVLGERVSEMTVADALCDFAGAYVLGPLERLEQRSKGILVFTSNYKQREALRSLKTRNFVPFTFWAPEE